MKLAPLHLWRKATAARAPNVIDDIDEFERNMGCVAFDAAVYATGIEFKSNRYSCNEMAEIVSEFERNTYLPNGDITPKQPRRNRNWKRKVSGRAKVKYDPDNLGRIHVWIPFGTNRRWVTLDCTNPDMIGMPVWLHEKALELAKVEANAFCPIEDQRVFRATLFEQIGNVSEKSVAKQRELLGRALDHAHVAKSFKQHVEMVPEAAAAKPQDTGTNEQHDQHPFADEISTAGGSLAGASRQDAMKLTPRPSLSKSPSPRTYAQIKRANRGTPSRMNKNESPRTPVPRKTGNGKRRGGLKLDWKKGSS